MARWTVQVATNLDVEAEAKGRPRIKIRPEAKDFEESAELQAVGNRPAGEADEEEGAGAGGGAPDGLAQALAALSSLGGLGAVAALLAPPTMTRRPTRSQCTMCAGPLRQSSSQTTARVDRMTSPTWDRVW